MCCVCQGSFYGPSSSHCQKWGTGHCFRPMIIFIIPTTLYLGHIVCVCSTFNLRHCQCFLCWFYSFIFVLIYVFIFFEMLPRLVSNFWVQISINKEWDFQFVHIFSSTWCCQFVLKLSSSYRLWQYLSLMSSGFQNAFIYLFAICLSCLGKFLFKYFSHFPIDFF